MSTLVRFTVVIALMLTGLNPAHAAIAAAIRVGNAARMPVAPVPLGIVQGRQAGLTQTANMSLSPSRLGASMTTLSAIPALATPRAAGTMPAPRAAVQRMEATAVMPAPPAVNSRMGLSQKGPVKANAAVSSQLAVGAKALQPLRSGKVGLGRSHALAGEFFDGADASFSSSEYRWPDRGEDARLDRGWQKLGESPTGLYVYRYVYDKYGSNLKVIVVEGSTDDYLARVEWPNGDPRIYMTEQFVDHASPEAMAAYLARELSEIYMKDFPESADRNYMAHSYLVRTFMELTESSNRWWATHKDWNNGRPYIKGIHDSWRTAVSDKQYRGRSVRNSAFFKWLKKWGGDNRGERSKWTLRQLYNHSKIGYRKFSEMDKYFKNFVKTELGWMSDNRQW